MLKEWLSRALGLEKLKEEAIAEAAEAIKTAVKTHTMPPALFPRKE